MRVSIMQPYFLPYIGYFQLIEASDIFIIYDNIKYTKKGWINRNRFLQNDSAEVFSIPLKKDSDSLDIKEREISNTFDKKKLISQIYNAYRQAPYFNECIRIFEEIVNFENCNLFEYVNNSVNLICKTLQISTEIEISSCIPVDHSLRSQEKVIAICQANLAKQYLNPIGGIELYSRDVFEENGINLNFLKTRPLEYRQFGSDFVPWLSIIDVMMFNSLEEIRGILENGFDLI